MFANSIAVRDGEGARGKPDHVAGATVSSAVIKDAVLRAARIVAGARGLLGAPPDQPAVERARFVPHTWSELADLGAFTPAHQPRGDRRRAWRGFERARCAVLRDLLRPDLAARDRTEPARPACLREVGGEHGRERARGADRGQRALFVQRHGVAAGGPVRSHSYRAGPTTITFPAGAHENVEQLAAEAPKLREAGVFRIPQGPPFDPAAPWRLELIVEQGGGACHFSCRIQTPGAFLAAPAAPAAGERCGSPELWREIWRARAPKSPFCSGCSPS